MPFSANFILFSIQSCFNMWKGYVEDRKYQRELAGKVFYRIKNMQIATAWRSWIVYVEKERHSERVQREAKIPGKGSHLLNESSKSRKQLEASLSQTLHLLRGLFSCFIFAFDLIVHFALHTLLFIIYYPQLLSRTWRKRC
jgi:hypothetical protein